MTLRTEKGLYKLIISMCIFDTIGILRKYLPLPSSFIALCRAGVGSAFLACIVLMRKEKLHFNEIKKNIIWLALSGAALGFNWIFLFESYNYTTVTTATLCYYMAPTMAVVASHFLFKEHLTVKKGLCVLVAFLGMILVSGAVGSEVPTASELTGVLFGLAAAVLYGSVILLNKKIAVGSPYVKTLFQLAVAGLVLLPYTALTENLSAVSFSLSTILLLAVAGIVHTGFAYALYFGSIKELKTQTVALLSYIDPILAIVLSALILHEPMGAKEIIGSVLILGAAYVSEK